MFFVKFIFVFLLFLSVIRLSIEMTRLMICLLANKKFVTTKIGNLLTTLATTYIVTVLTCGIPT